ncbi:MAG: orotate phosphoribosyltransferase [Firmicutes bacterium]|nr:orotate phosphoribosyltransferase [Bacillota bacterium]
MEMEKLYGDILQLILTRAYERKKVRLASGRESDFYIDCRRVTLTAEGVHKLARYILHLIHKEYPAVKAVGGPALGAVPLSAAISALSYASPSNTPPLDTFFVRAEPKKHGSGNKVDGPTLREGLPLLVLDDVLTTGGSLLKAVRAVQELGCRVEKVLVIVDRQEGGRENLTREGLSVASILTRADLEQAQARR